MNTTDAIGFTGVAMLLLAFFLQLINKISKDHYQYIIMNMIGAALSCYASVLLNYVPFIILEGVWTLVSVWAFINMMLKKKK